MNTMDRDAGAANIQDQYLTRARKERSWLTVVLNSGKKIGGRIVSFDRYTVILEDRGQEQMVFKHAIATINVSRSFSNSIQLDKARTGKDSSGHAPAASGEAQVKGDNPAAGGGARPEPADAD